MQISVSFLTSYYSQEKNLSEINKTSADYLHVDLMDGGFVPTKNFTIPHIKELLAEAQKPLDIHLMVFDPENYIADLKSLKPTYITFHLEATKNIVKTIEIIKKNNIKVGLAIKPNTDILELIPYLSFIDLVLVMSVEPGAGGQKFLESSINRVAFLKEYRDNNNLQYKIEIDGGINADTIKLVPNVDIAVSGSYICKSSNYESQIKSLKI